MHLVCCLSAFTEKAKRTEGLGRGLICKTTMAMDTTKYELTLRAKNIIVFFENAIAVNDISILLKKGEVVGLFGPNASGKTTILNVISGLILDIKKKEEKRGGQRITIKGKVFLNDEDITDLLPYRKAKKGIILSRERQSVFKESSVEENLYIAAFLVNKKDIKERIEFVYSIFPRLRSLRHRKAGLLSGGEQQMLSISMALMPNPKFILLDEPLFGLAPILYDELLYAIEKIKETGAGILIAEQFVIPVLPIIDRAYLIENGSLVFHGKKEELLKDVDIYSAYLG